MSSVDTEKIPTHCPQCAKAFLVSKTYVGRKTRCPDCQAFWIIAPPVLQPLAPLPPPQVNDLSDLLAETYPIAPGQSPVDAAVAAPEVRAPVFDPRFEAMERAYAREHTKSRDSSGGLSMVVGGLFTMAAAVIWFFAGLYVGVIFFYPPVLLLMGLGLFVRGIFRCLL